jgi:aspartokinase
MALCRVMDILATENILVTVGNSSALAMTVGVPLRQAEDAIRILHSQFLESKIL